MKEFLLVVVVALIKNTGFLYSFYYEIQALCEPSTTLANIQELNRCAPGAFWVLSDLICWNA